MEMSLARQDQIPALLEMFPHRLFQVEHQRRYRHGVDPRAAHALSTHPTDHNLGVVETLARGSQLEHREHSMVEPCRVSMNMFGKVGVKPRAHHTLQRLMHGGDVTAINMTKVREKENRIGTGIQLLAVGTMSEKFVMRNDSW